MMKLGPFKNCEVLVTDGYHPLPYDTYPDGSKYVCIEIEIISHDGAQSSDDLPIGKRVWLKLPVEASETNEIKIRSRLKVDLSATIDDLGTGKTSWGFEDGVFSILNPEIGQPLKEKPPFPYPTLRGIVILAWLILIGGMVVREFKRKNVCQKSIESISTSEKVSSTSPLIASLFWLNLIFLAVLIPKVWLFKEKCNVYGLWNSNHWEFSTQVIVRGTDIFCSWWFISVPFVFLGPFLIKSFDEWATIHQIFARRIIFFLGLMIIMVFWVKYLSLL